MVSSYVTLVAWVLDPLIVLSFLFCFGVWLGFIWAGTITKLICTQGPLLMGSKNPSISVEWGYLFLRVFTTKTADNREIYVCSSNTEVSKSYILFLLILRTVRMCAALEVLKSTLRFNRRLWLPCGGCMKQPWRKYLKWEEYLVHRSPEGETSRSIWA